METSLILSHSLIERDQAYIWHPFTQMQTARPPIPIVRGKGPYLYSAEGNRYVDAISSWFVNLHGHAHPYIAEKIKAQADLLEHVMFAGFTHASAVELASKLLSLLPGAMSKIFYSDNGSTAVETALKMALQYWFNQKKPRKRVICFKASYHGDTFGAMSAAGKNAFTKPFLKYLFPVEVIDPPLKGREEISVQQLRAILNQGESACFIFEPLVLGVGGMIIYPPEGLDRLIELCQEAEVLTIADEVLTGFGRTSTLFACEQLKRKPDLICLSKGITGGFLPLGVTACTQKIFDVFLSEKLEHALLHGHSYTANPLACTSAIANIDLLLQNSCFLQREKIALCHQEFCRQWQGHPKLKRCESLGTLLVLEYRAEQSSYFQPIGRSLYHFFLDRGIILRPFGNVLYVLPPYCIQEEELNLIYDQIIFTLESELP